MLRSNNIKDCPVISEDVRIAEDIFGPDVATLKGKSKRRKPEPVVEDIIEIPIELKLKNQNMTMGMDLMFINSVPFLTAIDRGPRYRSSIPLDSREHSECLRAIEDINRFYEQNGFGIDRIDCDNEFRALTDKVYDKTKIRLNCANPGDHVGDSENNNKVIKE